MERIYKGGKVEGNGEDIRKERGKGMKKIKGGKVEGNGEDIWKERGKERGKGMEKI